MRVSLDSVRSALFHVLTTQAGDGLAPVRIPKDLARRLNTALGRPLASRDDLEARRAAAAKLHALRGSVRVETMARAEVPVMIYFEKDRNQRELERTEDVLKARGIAWKRLDVTGDEAALAFVLREARCKQDELPIVFVGGKAVGDFRALVDFDVSGELVKAVFGDARPN